MIALCPFVYIFIHNFIFLEIRLVDWAGLNPSVDLVFAAASYQLNISSVIIFILPASLSATLLLLAAYKNYLSKKCSPAENAGALLITLAFFSAGLLIFSTIFASARLCALNPILYNFFSLFSGAIYAFLVLLAQLALIRYSLTTLSPNFCLSLRSSLKLKRAISHLPPLQISWGGNFIIYYKNAKIITDFYASRAVA